MKVSTNLDQRTESIHIHSEWYHSSVQMEWAKNSDSKSTMNKVISDFWNRFRPQIAVLHFLVAPCIPQALTNVKVIYTNMCHTRMLQLAGLLGTAIRKLLTRIT